MIDFRKIRREQEKTLEEVAASSGIALSYLSLIENGARRPSVEVAKRIGASLGFDWTLFYPDEPAEETPETAGEAQE